MQKHPDSKREKIMSEEKKAIDGQELENVSGGQGGGGFFMSVGNCNGSYLALRPQPFWDQYHELAKLYPGYTVFTYGATTNGTGVNGTPCTYRYVQYEGVWGYANASFLY